MPPRPGLNNGEMSRRTSSAAVPAYAVLPAAYAAMLLIGAVAAVLNGRLPGAVLVAVAILVTVASAIATPWAAPLLGLTGWLFVAGFSRPPYGQLRLGGPLAGHAAIVLAAGSLGGAALGIVLRRVITATGVRIVRGPAGSGPGPAGRSRPRNPAARPGLRPGWRRGDWPGSTGAGRSRARCWRRPCCRH